MAEIDYPYFEAWQSDDHGGNGWCLNIKPNAGQEPIEIRGLPSPGAVEGFVKGFLKRPGIRSDVSLSVTIHFPAQEMRMLCEDNSQHVLSASVTSGVSSEPLHEIL